MALRTPFLCVAAGPLPAITLLLALPACPAGDGDDSPEPTPFEILPWDKNQPEIDDLQVRGQREIRGIAHLHSHWSHDACDGEPQPDGVPDEACLQDLRDGLCGTRIDVAFLSDHPAHAEEADIETLLLLRGEDEVVLAADGVTPVANRMHCPDGHRVVLLPGVESGEMMPLAIRQHLPSGYGGGSAARYQEARDAGGLSWIAHTEQWALDSPPGEGEPEGHTLSELAAVEPDGFEIYQLHANLDPGIREEFLGLDAFGYLGEVTPFFFPDQAVLDPPHPDLAMLGFLSPNDASMRALEYVGQTRRVAGTGGSDAHRNVFPVDAPDGERVDSYRRMLRWFNNRIRIDLGGADEGGEITPEAARDGLGAGHAYVAFESFGTPEGFDFRAERSGEVVAQMGDELALGGEPLTLRVDLPSLDPRSPRSETAPRVRALLYRATVEGRELLADHDAAEDGGSVAVEVPGPGVYRVEVLITPAHVAPYLGEFVEEYVDREVPWILSNAIFVR